MGTMGKVLAVCNVLVAIGFLVVVAMDYSKRQAWAFVTLQADLAIQGIPLDENQKDNEGIAVVTYMSPKMQKELDLTDVRTQLEEIKKRQEAARGAITGEADDNAKKAKLLAVLLPTLPSQAERDDLRAAVQTKSIDDLLGPDGAFGLAFREAVEGRSAGGAQLGPGLQQKAIAHLLVTLGEQPEGYQNRALKVVGLQAYAAAVDEQSLALRQMIVSLHRTIDAERVAFADKHQKLLQEIVLLHDRIQDLNDTLQKEEKIREQHAALVNARQQEITDLQNQIKETEKQTGAALAAQSKLEQDLFSTQKSLGQTNDQNRQILQDIKDREQGR